MDTGKELTLEDVITSNLKPKALTGIDFENFYVDISEGRGENPMGKIERLLKNSDENSHILFAGYTGCGKSTELNKLQKLLELNNLVLNYSVIVELNAQTLNYIELFIVTMEKLFLLAQERKIPISKALLSTIQDWSSNTDLQKIKSFTSGLEVEAGVETNISIPFFLKFFGGIKGGMKYNSDNKEPRLSEFVGLCNALIWEIRKYAVSHLHLNGLVIIVEDLDKVPLEFAEKVFFDNTSILSSLQAHIIYTLPIAIRYHYKSKVLGTYFQIYDLKMVKVKNKDGQPFEKGRNLLFELVQKRLPDTLFESRNLILKFIDLSGGCIRDIFMMLNNAANAALDRGETRIEESHFNIAKNAIITDYRNTIAEKVVEGHVRVKVKEYYDILVELSSNANKQVENTEASLDLRYSQCILGYNGEDWVDLHPAVRHIVEERIGKKA